MNTKQRLGLFALLFASVIGQSDAQSDLREDYTVRVDGGMSYQDVGLDSLAGDTLFVTRNSVQYAIAIDRVEEIIWDRPSKGPLAAVIGAGVGLAIGLIPPSSRGHPDFSGVVPYFTTPIFAVAGYLVGLLISMDREYPFTGLDRIQRAMKIESMIQRDRDML